VRFYYDEYLEFGGFPKIVLEPHPERKKALLEDVFKSYFEKDVKNLADFGNLSQTRDLILLLSSRLAAKIEVSKLASELAVSRETIYRQLAFLEQTYLIGLLPKFSRSVDRQAAGVKKLYFLDTGLARFLGHASEGQWLENSVWQNLHPAFTNLTYFDKDHTEIDFIVNNQIGLEVKQSARLVEAKRLHQKSQNLGLKESYLISLNWSSLPEVVLATDL
jgi:predicted AAA+ superfamily ATPase